MKNLDFKRLFHTLRREYLTVNNVVLFMAFFIALSWSWGSVESMQRNYELQQMVDRKRHQVKLEKLRVALLAYEGRYYKSFEYQDLALRRRLGYGSPGERQIIVPSTDQPTAGKTGYDFKPAKRKTNFQLWVKFLFGGKR